MQDFENVLTGICFFLVCIGIIPIVAIAYQFLAIPIHAFKNHYHKAAPYLPNVYVVIPAWNEGAVLNHSVERLLNLEYPEESLRVCIIDDASTDNTPEVAAGLIERYPGRVLHLRREKGGEGKAHTLNHGLRIILEEDWGEAFLITDADVIFSPPSLRRMTRHLADPEVGAVTAYIREGTPHPNFLNRFIGVEYILAQAASRRAQNVFGAVACLAGGAQLHSRANLEELGGQIDTHTLAEDTVTTFRTQLDGRRVVFDPYAEVLAEEPNKIVGLWKQRLRWARGNVQVTSMFRTVWFRRSRKHKLGTISFAVFWFSLFLLPVAMLLSTLGLLGLFFLQSVFTVAVFRVLWALAGATYIFGMVMGIEIDVRVGLRSWREAIFFPGTVSIIVLIAALFPGFLEEDLPGLFGITLSAGVLKVWTLFTYVWIIISMFFAWLVKIIDSTKIGSFFSPLLTYIVGYGPILCAITVDSYLKEFKKAPQVWDKTEKTGKVLG